LTSVFFGAGSSVVGRVGAGAIDLVENRFGLSLIDIILELVSVLMPNLNSSFFAFDFADFLFTFLDM
jgi:hypothetical protein